MARILRQLTLFVSGPSDVDDEKAALRVVAEEITRRLEKTQGVCLRVVGWPDDIRPGVNIDPQLEINRQVGEDFDIYVGILGTRFGTETARSGSGTQEEFERALSKFKNDSTSVRVLFYFKRAAADPFSLNIEQLGQVRRFRDGLGGRGVLFRDVRDTGEFTKLAREHLDGLIIDDWRDDKWSPIVFTASGAALVPTRDAAPSITASTDSRRNESSNDFELAAESGGDDDELGVLDYMAGLHEASAALVDVMDAISKETERVGEEIRARAAETDLVGEQLKKAKAIGGSRAQQDLLGQARALVDRAASNLDDFVVGMTSNVEQFKIHIRALFDNMGRTFTASVELGPQDTTEDRAALAKLIPVMHESRDHVIGFQSSVSGVPALTGRFKRSRKRTAAVLGELIAEMSFAIQRAKDLLDDMGGEPGEPTA